MGTVHVYEPDGGYRHWEANTLPERTELVKLVGGHLEYVHVLFNEKPTYMVVNETGAIQRPPLPVNHAATDVYWNASRRRGQEPNPKTWPRIHGTAVVLEDIHVP